MTLVTLSTASSFCKVGARHVDFLYSLTMTLERSWGGSYCLKIYALLGSGPLHSPGSHFGHMVPAGAARLLENPTPPTPLDTEGTHKM